MTIRKVTKRAPIKTNSNSDNYIYSTIQSAIDHAKPGDLIKIENGRYYEKLHITTSGLTLIGESIEECIITYDDYALKDHKDGKAYGTFRSYTCLVLADDVIFKNITIENSAGDGRKVGQAIALYAQGDRLTFINCKLLGHQDTLFAGPLPPKSIIPGSFIGPSEKREYKQSKQYYENCYIIGDIDFIFGSALAVFKECQCVTRNRSEKINGFVTAPSTWEGEPYGFVFLDCSFNGEEGIDPGTVFLGRPWRPYGQVELINCTYDDSIHKERWDPWGKEENKLTTRFSEYSKVVIPYEKDQSPFITIKRERPKIDFLDPWHQKMISIK